MFFAQNGMREREWQIMFGSVPSKQTHIPDGGDESARKSTRELKVWQTARNKEDKK